MDNVMCRFKRGGGFSVFKRVVSWMGGLGAGLKKDSKHP
jgi:hypothetical protein